MVTGSTKRRKENRLCEVDVSFIYLFSSRKISRAPEHVQTQLMLAFLDHSIIQSKNAQVVAQ